MNRTVAIVHYNTPELTTALVKSIRKHTAGCRIVIFDNSTLRPFPAMDGVEVIDNTMGQIIDFGALIERYPDRVKTCNSHASSKHIASVDWFFDYLPEGFLLMDSDVLVKEDISPLFNERMAWVGTVDDSPEYWFQTPRLLPFLLWINVPMCREHGVRFWAEGRSYKLSHQGPPYHDTGASFWEDCKAANLPGREINIYRYIEHYGAGSYSFSNPRAWLDEHRKYWQS